MLQVVVMMRDLEHVLSFVLLGRFWLLVDMFWLQKHSLGNPAQ